MLQVQGEVGQADAHLITFADGRRVLVDAGEAVDASGTLLAQLRQHGVSRLSVVVISHFHQDHYGRLLSLIESGIAVDRVVVNVPQRQVADREIPWGCNFNDVVATVQALQRRGIVVHHARAGDRLIEVAHQDEKAGIDVLCAYDGVNTPIGETDVNDTSIILRLFHGTTRALLAGDLNHPLGAYLASGEVDLRADILKAPHHGTEGCAPNAFFDRVGASAVLVPSPAHLWRSDRSARVRSYFEQREIPCFVNGFHGSITVALVQGSYRVVSVVGGIDRTVRLEPGVIIPPADASVFLGDAVTLSAMVSGAPQPAFQWMKDGLPIPGATDASLCLQNVEPADAGTYVLQVTNPHGTVQSRRAVLSLLAEARASAPQRFTNLSARGWAGSGDATLIAGFVIRGEGSKALLIRGVGTTLSIFGIAAPLPDPHLTLYSGDGRILRTNDTWSASPSARAIREAAGRSGAFPLPTGSSDAAILCGLPAGAYTVHLRDLRGGAGIGLIELYDLETSTTARLVNLSARSEVAPGEAALIGGFVCSAATPQRLLCRAVGPSLRTFGIDRYLARPRLSLHGSSAASLDSSQLGPAAITSAVRDAGAFVLFDGSADVSALVAVQQEIRTAVVSGTDLEAGVALLEFYLLP